MDLPAYFRSVSAELDALRDRVRHLIHGEHWPTDGEWKESVLRTVLRRSAPDTLTIGRGFVVDHHWCSSQIDVLLYDNTLPVLYRDGDLAFITPSSCRGIVEVKTSINRRRLEGAAEKLADDAQRIRALNLDFPLFTGIFAYELEGAVRDGLRALQEVAGGDEQRVVEHAALGPSEFIKYWAKPPTGGVRRHRQWHRYQLPQMAPGYFVHNLLAQAARDPAARRENAWWPRESKEARLVDQLGLTDG